MNYRTISTKYLKTTTEQELKVEVYYSKGGANYLAGGTIQRGYWLSVQPVSGLSQMDSEANHSPWAVV